YTSHCLLHLTYFPFDTHTCTLTWASWSYDIHQLDLVKGGEGSGEGELGDLSSYQPNGEFQVTDLGGRGASPTSPAAQSLALVSPSL
ncbi:hypothetical protein Pcinc_044158, partial [Petrolisthes cinctipes]